MKEMNSLTHSCMHSFASLAILAFSGSAIFMIRATGAKLRMLASQAKLERELFEVFVFFGVECGGEVDDGGEEDDMSLAARRPSFRHRESPTGSRQTRGFVIRRRTARLQSM